MNVSPKRFLIDTLEMRILLAGLTGQYFDRVDFTNLKQTETDPTINFNWSAAPVSGMQPDNYSIRWTGQVQAEYSETTTFYVAADDGARLWVDGRLLIDNWTSPTTSEQSAQLALTVGQKYDIRLDYLQTTGAAQVALSWSSTSLAKQIIPSSQLFTSPSGLEATYYANNDFTNPKVTRNDPSVNFDWGTGSPDPSIGADHFSVQWAGEILPQLSQTYSFTVPTDSDATVQLRVDGQLVVDSTSVQPSGQIQLEAGKLYAIQLNYVEGTGAANVQLHWSAPSLPDQVIPNSALFAAATTSIPTRYASYTNPVLNIDAPDPGVIYADGYYWMTHTTGGPDTGWPLYKSTDMTSWTFVTNLLNSSNEPAWMTDSFWAPEIHKINGNFVITGTAYSSQYGHLCIAIGTASEITGPYTVETTPIVADSVNVLDSDIFLDNNGSVYLIWKRDGPNGGQFGSIEIQQMNSTATALARGSSPTEILDNNFGGWENNLAEAPWMIHRGQYYYLFYSGAFIDTTYSEGVARATSPTVMFTRNPANPIISNNSTWGGPGHGGFAEDVDGTYWFLYHARYQSNPDYGRVQVLDKIVWTSDGWPSVGNAGTPSTTLQVGPHVDADSGSGNVSVDGTSASDSFSLSRDNPSTAMLDIVNNRVTQSSLTFAELQTLTVNSGRNTGGNDLVTLDFSRGEVIPGAGLIVNNMDSNDTVRIVGASATDAFHAGTGTITHGTGIASIHSPGSIEFSQGTFNVDSDLQSATYRPTLTIGQTASAQLNTTQHLALLTLVDGAVVALANDRSIVLSTTGLQLNGSAKLDLANGAFIDDYTGATPAATIRFELAKGFAGGTWTGNGITSSSAAADNRMAIGYGEASILAPGGTFDSQPVDSTAIVTAYTFKGDANLDGTVNSADFALLAAHYGMTNATWADGDFNYDGVVNALDFNAMATLYGSHPSSTVPAAATLTSHAVSASPTQSLFSASPIGADLVGEVLS